MHGRLVVEIARDSMSVAVTVYTDGKTVIRRAREKKLWKHIRW